MKLLVNNVTTKLTSATFKEIAWLDAYLSFNSTGMGGKEKQQSLYDVLNRCFPTGLLEMVKKQAFTDKIHLEIMDARRSPVEGSSIDLSAPELGYLRPYQKEALKAAIESGRGILELFTGAGKCLGAGTQIVKYDGSLISVEDVQNGDLLMGPDSMPRNVTATTKGYGPLFRITPNKGAAWVCNSRHVLCLVHTKTNELVDVELCEYLKWTKSKKHQYKLYQSPEIHFGTFGDLPVDPYFLGIWLGDGTKSLKSVAISKPNPEILKCCQKIANDFGLRVYTYNNSQCPTHFIVGSKGKTNKLLAKMRELMSGGVCIPQQYLTATYNERMALLAGLLDTDGHCTHGYFEITQKNSRLASDIAFLARSLGYKVTEKVKKLKGREYQRLNILGDVSIIPTKIKKAPVPSKNKDQRRSGFSIESVGDGWFYGFSLDADHRFLLWDFTVTHNTEIAIGLHLALSQPKPIQTLMIVTAQNLLHQTAQRFHERTGKLAGVIGDGVCSIGDFTVATFQSLYALAKNGSIGLAQFDAVILDECHTTAANTYWEVTKKLVNCYYRIALSATALKRADKKDLYTVAATGNVLYKLSIRDGVELNAVAPPNVYLRRYHHHAIYPYAFGEVYRHAIVENVLRNMQGISLIQTAKKPVIAFVKHKEHGEQLMALLASTAPELRCVFVHGKDKKSLKIAKQKIEENGLDVIVSTDVLATGTDIPEIMSLVNLAGMKAEIGVIQKVGRAARKYKDGESIKTSFDVYDLLDTGSDPEHQSHAWLIDHANERMESYKSLGFGVNVI